MDSFDKLIYLNQELFSMIENSISLDLLARLYSSQLITRGEKHLLAVLLSLTPADHPRGTAGWTAL